MITWLDKICYPLEHPKYPQIKKRLVLYGRDGKIIGKCAEGEIACQNKLPIDSDGEGTLNPEDFIKLGVPEDLARYGCLPYLSEMFDFDRWSEINGCIGEYIVSMNDTLDFTESEIAEFLRTTFEDAV